MPNYQQGDKQISDGVNLLISILVRYPEVGTITYNSSNQSIKLTFLLTGSPEKKHMDFITDHITHSLDAYHILKNMKDTLVEICMNSYENMAMLTIIRDVGSLSRGEIALIIALLREKAIDLLVTDQSEFLVEEDLLIQEELIENMLENMKKKYDSHSLIGIREDGRVLVFNK
ncbi:hypothetical protein AXX12_03100 [Anaerosporomusa subterranea]|uniref:Uncharacterized protein n=1 Tax=Anaerosporomusa subterranea TaxID=1794912 RepID=A0A154BT37_ANASB|nr:hypothetical protein [Anaerosporomusa subterranea]KYZ77136.1 hypothetical protein AXX12_03100 [Anaerosporomusa subterranea]